jgi:hypothetical protein
MSKHNEIDYMSSTFFTDLWNSDVGPILIGFAIGLVIVAVVIGGAWYLEERELNQWIARIKGREELESRRKRVAVPEPEPELSRGQQAAAVFVGGVLAVCVLRLYDWLVARNVRRAAKR